VQGVVLELGWPGPLMSQSLFSRLRPSTHMVHGLHIFLYFDVRTQRAAIPLQVGCFPEGA
jgi:hypothetical protein